MENHQEFINWIRQQEPINIINMEEMNLMNINNELIPQQPIYVTFEAVDNTSLISKAIIKNDLKLMISLCDQKLNVNEMDDNNCTPLYYAVVKNNFEMVELLLSKYNANPNIFKNNNHFCDESPLIKSVRIKNIPITELLLKYGAKINDQDSYGHTALHFACRFYDYNQIELLLNYGADINIKSFEYNESIFNVSGSHIVDFVNVYFLRKKLITLWELESLFYISFIQWLPQELIFDLNDLLKHCSMTQKPIMIGGYDY